ncbi:MAG TPA: RNA polymerase sigma factor [Lentimicrobium sp.]|nr:RNA polymerase sigma factor [Lentimicrobium sp.]
MAGQSKDDIMHDNATSAKWLVDAYQVKVYNVCYSLLHNHHNAEDVTQDVFLEVIKHIDSFRGDSKLSTWIYRIAVNRSLNFIRSARKRQIFKYIDELLSLSVSEESNFAYRPDPGNQDEQRLILQKALDTLPEKQRIAFTLNKIDDLSYKEISEIMNISHASVESLIHRAKLKLQKLLKDYYR